MEILERSHLPDPYASKLPGCGSGLYAERFASRGAIAAGTPTTKGQSILAIVGFVNVACQFLAAVGFLAPFQPLFVAGLIFLMYVSVHNFVLLLVIGPNDEA